MTKVAYTYTLLSLMVVPYVTEQRPLKYVEIFLTNFLCLLWTYFLETLPNNVVSPALKRVLTI